MKKKDFTIYFENLENIIYENIDRKYIGNEKEVKEFLNLFFFMDNLLFLSEIYMDAIDETKVRYLFFSNKINLRILKSTGFFKENKAVVKVYNENIIYEIETNGKLTIKENEELKLDEDTAEKILENYKAINSSITFIFFYYGDVINQIKKINLKFDSKILSNESQNNIILKGIEHTNKIFHIKNAYKHYYKNVLKKLKKVVIIN